VRRSTTILGMIALGAMLATGSATASMARSRHHAAGFGGGNFDFHLGLQDIPHDTGVLGDSGYHDQTWWNYDTDAAYCSFDAVNPRYEGPSGTWHYCP
jgi:hypothetical protein